MSFRNFLTLSSINSFLIYSIIHGLAYGQEIYKLTPSGTAPDAFIWAPQSDTDYRGPMVISQNLADFSTKSYPDETDPTMFWGYNHLLSGLEIVPRGCGDRRYSKT